MKLKVFIGPKGSGKDTCAKILQDAGITAGKIPFAGPLKQICSEVFGIPLEVFEDPIAKETDFETPIILDPGTDNIFHLMRTAGSYTPGNDGSLDLHIMNFAFMMFRSPRHLLQFVGTEILRAYDPDWHCKAAFSQEYIEDIFGGCTDTCQSFFQHPFAITDCRFLNEYLYLRQNHECEFYYVERPEAEERLALATHQSELEVKELRKLIQDENVIRNDDTVGSLIIRTFTHVERYKA